MDGFWTDRRVVVTGGAGMVGTALCRLLRDQGAHVTVLDDGSRGTNRLDRVEYIYGDAGSAIIGERLFESAFAVFNLAAVVAGVIHNQTHHAEMFEANMRLQAAPVIAAARARVTHFLQVSSVCVYDPRFNHPCLEENGTIGEPHPANLGYSMAKRMGEQAVLWANLPHAVIVRPSNIYGPRDYFDERAHVIPALIKKALADDVIRVNGSGNEVREFLYVDDAAAGMMAALEHGAPNNAYNIGTNGRTAVPIHTLVSEIARAVGCEHKPIEYSTRYSAGDAARWSEASRLMGFGWEPQMTLADGVARTVAWYRGTLAGQAR